MRNYLFIYLLLLLLLLIFNFFWLFLFVLTDDKIFCFVVFFNYYFYARVINLV
ncbi:hypothetical protein ACMBCN_01775 [Candidatus Liberibacter asiaticus]|nr:hypothetical protein [Candidatus Liberibacter asiaticus]